MSVVLRGEELIFRREWPVDLAHVQLPAIDAGRGERLGQIRERHQDFSLCQGWEHELRQPQNPKTRDGQAALQKVATRMCCVHWAVPPHESHITTGRLSEPC